MVLALDIDFHNNLSAGDVEQAIERLQDSIKGQRPEFKRIFIEAKSLTNSDRTESI